MDHPLDCNICNNIQPNITNVENARNLGVDEATIRRHKAHLAKIDSTDEFFGVPTEIITARGKTVRLPDGSYEKITYNPHKALVDEALSYEDVEKLLLDYTYVPQQTIGATESFSLVLADVQAGKVDVLGGMDGLTKRFLDTIHLHAERLTDRPVEEIVLIDAGDVIENFYNTSAQRQTNDAYLTLQVRIARNLMAKAVMLFAPLANKVTFISVPSNHGQVRVAPKSPASVPEDDFGIDINYSLEEQFDGRLGFEHVRFVRPDPFMEAVVHTTADGTNIGVVHGHQVTSAFKVGDWWKGQSHGRRNNFHHADILIAGHFHNFATYPSGDDRRVFIGPSIDNGSSWYANLTGESSAPAMLSLFVENGQWKDIYVR